MKFVKIQATSKISKCYSGRCIWSVGEKLEVRDQDEKLTRPLGLDFSDGKLALNAGSPGSRPKQSNTGFDLSW